MERINNDGSRLGRRLGCRERVGKIDLVGLSEIEGFRVEIIGIDDGIAEGKHDGDFVRT